MYSEQVLLVVLTAWAEARKAEMMKSHLEDWDAAFDRLLAGNYDHDTYTTCIKVLDWSIGEEAMPWLVIPLTTYEIMGAYRELVDVVQHEIYKKEESK